VIDTAPRHEGLADDERETLRELAAIVMDELELRTTQRHRDEVLESITDAFFAVDGDWRFTYVNQQAETLLQRSREELLGQNVWEEFPEAVELAFHEQYHRAVREGESVQFEAHFPPLQAWFRVHAYPFEGGLSVYFDDVTEEKRQREELKMMSRAVEKAAEAVIITEGAPLDPPGPRIEYVNPAFERMTGYAADEAIGQTPRMLQGPETGRAVLDVVRSHLRAGKPLTQTTTVNYRKDGTPFWVEWNIAPVHDEDGIIRHWVSVQRDVTKQRRLEAALRAREEYLSVTLNSIGDAVIATDSGGHITEMNAVAEQLTGWSRAEAEGRPLREILEIHNAKTGEPVRNPVAEVLEEGEAIGLANHTVLTARDGTERQIADSAAPIRTVGSNGQVEGDLLGVVMVFRDVTTQYRRQEALDEERQRLELALIGGNLGMWDMHLDKGQNIVNDRWAEMLGFTLEEVGDRQAFFESRTHPDDLERAYAMMERHARGEIPLVDLEIRMRHKDGTWRWILDRGKVVEWNDDGSPRRAVGTHMDITERKQREAELMAAKEKAEEMSRLKSAFLANMSHEVRTPLTSIIGFAEVLDRMDLPASADRFTHLIYRGGTRLLNTLNSVLDLSQLEAGAMTLRPREVTVRSLIIDIKQGFQHHASEAGVALTVEVPPDPVRAQLDRGAIERVVSNLLDNAIKFTSVRDRTDRRVHLALTAEPDRIEIAVTDTGVGIDPEFVPRLFDAFHQESTGDAREFEGSGLGLSITERLVNLMGGTITVDSEKGKGTTFTVTLPRAMPGRSQGESDAGS
jgi:PAS domain S-box-containing protein